MLPPHHLRLGEQCRGAGHVSRLVQGLGQGRAFPAQEGVIATIGQGNGLAGCLHRPRHRADCQVQPAQIAAVDGRINPVILRNGHLQPGLHRLRGLDQPPQRLQVDAGLVQNPGLPILLQLRGRPAPRLIEEPGQRSQVRAERAQLLRL